MTGTSTRLSEQTVLVTGGGGFIGSHLVKALAPHNDVRVLDDFSSGRRDRLPESATVITGDIRDETTVARAMDGVDVVFHEAALVSVEASVDDPVHSHGVNVDATITALEHARAEDARAVLASSAAVYGHPETTPIAETARLTPTSPYGLDKLALDHYGRLYHDLYGVETVVLRYFNAYGPGQMGGQYSAVIGAFLRRARAGDPIEIHGDGEQTRDFIHVDDIVRANLRAATTDAVGEAYNVATGESTSIRNLAETIRETTGSDSEIVHTDPREGDIDHSVADVSKARRTLGFEPTITLRDGLRTLDS